MGVPMPPLRGSNPPPMLPAGYATESLSLGGLRALVLGAPRYRHVGRLLLFVLQRGGKWELRSDAVGRQVMVGGRVGHSMGWEQPRG